MVAPKSSRDARVARRCPRAIALAVALALSLTSMLSPFSETYDIASFSVLVNEAALAPPATRSEPNTTVSDETTQRAVAPIEKIPPTATGAETTTTLSSTIPLISMTSNDEDPMLIQAGKKDSFFVLDEDDLVADEDRNATGEERFRGTYFDSKPSCDPVASEEVSFTLVTQASPDRLWIMKHHCRRWPAPLPISLAVYLPPGAPRNATHGVVRDLEENFGCDTSRMKVTILNGSTSLGLYPVNHLRNLAIEAANTTHIFYTDSDFLVSDGLHGDLIELAAPIVGPDPRVAMVVPAFALSSSCGRVSSDTHEAMACLEKEVPKNKKDLMRIWKKGVQPNVKAGFHGEHFHSTTQYDSWKNQTHPIELPCLKNYLYEPYVAVRLCRDLPEFPRYFRGYGWNKNIWIRWLLYKRGYRLWQLPRGFVLHLPHKESVSKKIFKAETIGKGKKQINPDFEPYLYWFKKLLPNHPNRFPMCPNLQKKKDKKRKKKKQKKQTGVTGSQ